MNTGFVVPFGHFAQVEDGSGNFLFHGEGVHLVDENPDLVEQIEAPSADNVLITVVATINWRISGHSCERVWPHSCHVIAIVACVSMTGEL